MSLLSLFCCTQSSYFSINGRRVNFINKPAATRPDASDNSMTEATSMVVDSRSSALYSPAFLCKYNMVWTLFLLLPHEECLFLSILGFETLLQPVYVILGEIFVSLLEHSCLITRIICQTKRTESLLMCPLSCHSMLRWPNYGGLRRGNYRPRNCHKSDTATNISMPSPTVGTNQKACPAAQGSFAEAQWVTSAE